MPNVIEIGDFGAPELDVYARLTEAQLRSRRETEKGIFIAESLKVIEYALGAGCKPISFLMERKHIEGQAKSLLERCGEVPVYTADREVLAGLTGYELTRGILCAMRRPDMPSVEEICKKARRIVVLDGIVDPTNIGAIFRSAAALNMDAVLVTPSCCDPLYRRAVRVSMGTIFQIPWTRIGEHSSQWPWPGLERLRDMGFKTAAMALTDRSISIEDAKLRKEEKLAVVMGSE
jgi:tRNA G18 (ribose-2'-O)-methylase SpoU